MIANQDMRSCSNQEIFSFVVQHLREQGQQACDWEDDLGCQLRVQARGGKMLACAVGCLIPDCDYTPELEGTPGAPDGQGSSFSNNDLLKAYFPARMHDLLEDLQEVHDYKLPTKWETQLREVGAKHKLVFPERS